MKDRLRPWLKICPGAGDVPCGALAKWTRDFLTCGLREYRCDYGHLTHVQLSEAELAQLREKGAA